MQTDYYISKIQLHYFPFLSIWCMHTCLSKFMTANFRRLAILSQHVQILFLVRLNVFIPEASKEKERKHVWKIKHYTTRAQMVFNGLESNIPSHTGQQSRWLQPWSTQKNPQDRLVRSLSVWCYSPCKHGNHPKGIAQHHEWNVTSNGFGNKLRNAQHSHPPSCLPNGISHPFSTSLSEPSATPLFH